MRFHGTIVGIFLMLAGGFVLHQAVGFPQMPGQSIGPGTFPTVFALAFVAGGAFIALQGWRSRSAARLIALDASWKNGGRRASAFIAIFGTLALAAYFDEIGFPLGAALLLAALYVALGHRSPVWFAVSICFAGTVWYGMAKLLLVPLPLGPFG